MTARIIAVTDASSKVVANACQFISNLPFLIGKLKSDTPVRQVCKYKNRKA